MYNLEQLEVIEDTIEDKLDSRLEDKLEEDIREREVLEDILSITLTAIEKEGKDSSSRSKEELEEIKLSLENSLEAIKLDYKETGTYEVYRSEVIMDLLDTIDKELEGYR